MALISYGARGDSVSQLQQQLQAAGFDPGPIDGVFGPKTQAAVKAYQTANGLTVDGIVGNQTTSSLVSNLANTPTAAPTTTPTAAPTPYVAPASLRTGAYSAPTASQQLDDLRRETQQIRAASPPPAPVTTTTQPAAPTPTASQDYNSLRQEMNTIKAPTTTTSSLPNRAVSGYTLPTGVTNVADIQRQLGITVDGLWGPQTQAAYDAMQRPTASQDYNSLRQEMNAIKSPAPVTTTTQPAAPTPTASQDYNSLRQEMNTIKSPAPVTTTPRPATPVVAQQTATPQPTATTQRPAPSPSTAPIVAPTAPTTTPTPAPQTQAPAQDETRALIESLAQQIATMQQQPQNREAELQQIMQQMQQPSQTDQQPSQTDQQLMEMLTALQNQFNAPRQPSASETALMEMLSGLQSSITQQQDAYNQQINAYNQQRDELRGRADQILNTDNYQSILDTVLGQLEPALQQTNAGIDQYTTEAQRQSDIDAERRGVFNAGFTQDQFRRIGESGQQMKNSARAQAQQNAVGQARDFVNQQLQALGISNDMLTDSQRAAMGQLEQSISTLFGQADLGLSADRQQLNREQFNQDLLQRSFDNTFAALKFDQQIKQFEQEMGFNYAQLNSQDQRHIIDSMLASREMEIMEGKYGQDAAIRMAELQQRAQEAAYDFTNRQAEADALKTRYASEAAQDSWEMQMEKMFLVQNVSDQLMTMLEAGQADRNLIPTKEEMLAVIEPYKGIDGVYNVLKDMVNSMEQEVSTTQQQRVSDGQEFNRATDFFTGNSPLTPILGQPAAINTLFTSQQDTALKRILDAVSKLIPFVPGPTEIEQRRANSGR